MFHKKTLFVIGAGASKEFDLPTGAELTRIIADEAAVPRGKDLNKILADRNSGTTSFLEYHAALERITKGIHLARSIDSFIDQNPDTPAIAEIGKLLIAKAILEAERRSPLYVDEYEGGLDLRNERLTKSWLDEFTAMLFQGLRRDDLDGLGQNVAVVCFNYDRCIEHYLTHAISATYGVKYDEALRLVSTIQIIHPYGQIGTLPGQEYEANESDGVVPFGYDFPPSALWILKNGLKTYSESAGSDIRSSISALVHEADQVVYLGFSFAEQNMALLTASHSSEHTQISYASGFGIPEQAREEISRRMWDVIRVHPARRGAKSTYKAFLERDLTAGETLRTHSYNLLRRA